MNIKLYFIGISLFLSSPFFGWTQKTDGKVDKPKLIVGIVVDQMRYDFLYRYYDRYSDDGFKRLIKQGISCEQTYYNYMPTYTGPGHASIYTGTTPSHHGIIANNWFDKDQQSMVYCAGDPKMQSVGSGSAAGRMSPHRMMVTTVTDQLQLSTIGRSKVIGISLKDRGAVLPAGHMGDAAYWLDDAGPNWITSSYYMTALPEWVERFNKRGLGQEYLAKKWETLYPIKSYASSTADDMPYEAAVGGAAKPTFPYDLKSLSASNPSGVLRNTPFGNSFTTDFAIATIEEEDLGKDDQPDFLCISYSSTDYVGHAYGPSSIEIEDTYLRLDRDIKRLLEALDKSVGLDQVLIFLTADHGVSEVPAYLQSQKIPALIVDEDDLIRKVKQFCINEYGDSLISGYTNQQIFFSDKVLRYRNETRRELQEKVAGCIQSLNKNYTIYTGYQMHNNEYSGFPAQQIQAGFHPGRSGDVLINYPAQFIDFGNKGTTHGSPYTYDTHVPLIWFGWQIAPGTYYERVNITDIAVTLSAKLKILNPSAATGKVILPVLNNP